ncbi:hypothetical protein NDN08_004882 [Rhodosorus marinus]|uniref:Uncharacterized protein n=1 Tax=Rhodosorus marinus TaxID=101924 RepID=A0AAV8UEX7_9RHOD|nr:hypothetical protein NDN08_004882 [Rhodosorus marinus]
MNRLAAFVLLSMAFLKLATGATTCEADPMKGLFGHDGACFDLVDSDGVKHGSVCTSTVALKRGMCIRAKYSAENAGSSVLKLRGGLHKKDERITKRWSRYTRKRTVASINSPDTSSASLYFCPSNISVLELPCCGADHQFLGFAVIAVPGSEPDSDRMQVKAYVAPQTTTADGICSTRTGGGGREEFLCTLSVTCDSCPNRACNDKGTCVKRIDYACGDAEVLVDANATPAETMYALMGLTAV